MMAPSGGKQKIETQGWNLHTVEDTSVGCYWLFSSQLEYSIVSVLVWLLFVLVWLLSRLVLLV